MRQRFLEADGALVQIAPRSTAKDTPAPAQWQVRGGRFFLVGASEMPVLNKGLADIDLYLPTGIHQFSAWLQPVEPTRWEVFPVQSVVVDQRRGAARMLLQSTASFGVVPESPERPGVVHDLSANGLSFSSEVQIAIGARCIFKLEGPPGDLLGSLTGTVVRRTPTETEFSYGVKLTGDSEEKYKIYSFLAACRRSKAR